MMVRTIRALLVGFAGLVATLQSALCLPSEKAGKSATPQVGARHGANLFMHLREDPEFRARFAANPAAALRELGLDPMLFNLPERLDEPQLRRVANRRIDWRTKPVAPASDQSDRKLAESPPVPVYGPPPRPQPIPPSPKPKPRPQSNHEVAPPVAVYGPPPGLPRKP